MAVLLFFYLYSESFILQMSAQACCHYKWIPWVLPEHQRATLVLSQSTVYANKNTCFSAKAFSGVWDRSEFLIP